MEDREKMVQLKMELGAENAENGEGSGRVGEETSETAVSQERIVEAVLFTMGKSVDTRRLALAIDGTAEEARAAALRLKAKYEAEERGMDIIELEDSFQMCTRAQYYENLIKVASAPKKQVLTDVVLETLSIIAYKQPVTKLEIEKIRGVKSDHAVSRLDAPGRPALFATTEEFLRRFGVGSTKDLPVINPARVDEFKQEVEEELKFVDEAAASGEETGEEKD